MDLDVCLTKTLSVVTVSSEFHHKLDVQTTSLLFLSMLFFVLHLDTAEVGWAQIPPVVESN